MTFSFVMDAFPDYTAFDKQHKVFAAIQIIGEENIHPDTEVANPEQECPALAIEFKSVKAGAADWSTKEFPGDAKKVQFTTLGNSLKATIDRANIDFQGNLRRVDNWTAFSSNPKDLTGYYFPFTMEAEDGDKFVRTLPSTGMEKELVFGQTDDGTGKINMIFAVDPAAPVVTAYLKSKDGSKTTEYSFDFSRCVFK